MRLLSVTLVTPRVGTPVWNQREAATAYAEGKFDPDKANDNNNVLPTKDGGRIGVMELTESGPVLYQYYNREDAIPIEFGRFVLK